MKEDGDAVRQINLHFMKPFDTGDDKDMKLSVSKDWNAEVVIRVPDRDEATATGTMYLDDPSNPTVMSGAAFVGFGVSAGLVMASLF